MRNKRRNGRFSNIKLVYRPGSNLIKIALLAVIAFSTAALVTIHVAIDQNQTLLEAKRQEALLLEQENQALEQDIENLGSRDSIIEIAGKQLGLVPNIILYITAD
jgi:cell division protein FtsL